MISPPRTLRAFTLVELLTAVAIIAILASLGLAGYSRIKASAGSAKCVSNLRQIYLLSSLWSQDNDGWVPQAVWWTSTLPQFTTLRSVGLTDSLLRCPSSQFPIPNYGLNANYVWSDGWGPDGYWNHGLYKALLIKPTTIYYAETSPVSDGSTSLSSKRRMAYPHNGRGNVVFMDGHVQALSLKEMTDNYNNPGENWWTPRLN